MAGVQAKYPWNKWIGEKGHRQIIHREKHFTCQTASMSVQIRHKAAKLGMRVRVSVDGNKITITNLGRSKRA